MKKAFAAILVTMGLLTAVQVQASVGKNDRVLVVVSELQQHGPQNLRGLYEVLENLTQVQTNIILGDDYRQIIYLRRESATLAQFRSTLLGLASRPDVKAIDLIMSLHGSDGSLYFREGRVRVANMVTTMTQASTAGQRQIIASLHKKLRMVYNLSCFGRSHNQAFIDMGFDVSVGSNGVNANSELEYTPALTAWSFGAKWGDSFAATNNDAALFAADQPVRMAGISADSKKFFRGTLATKISSNPLE